MGYGLRDGTYRHPSRTAIFVGDLIDCGPNQLRVLQTVKAMVDAGSARTVPGNHGLIQRHQVLVALSYATEWPRGSGKYLLPRTIPGHPWPAKN